MNEWFMVKQVGIKGKGGFATKDIPKGTSIIEYKGKVITKATAEKTENKHKSKGELWVFTLNEHQDIDATRGGNEAKFINHSCEPNCEAINYDDEEIWIEAIRDIKKGEELTYNYGFDEPDEYFPCYCQSKNCRGWIVSEDYVFKPGEKEELQQAHEELKTDPKLKGKTHFK
jgi:SET domain-containing protein